MRCSRCNLWRLGRMMAPGIFGRGGGSIFQDVTSKGVSLLSRFALGPPAGVAIILAGQGRPLSPGTEDGPPGFKLGGTIACGTRSI